MKKFSMLCFCGALSIMSAINLPHAQAKPSAPRTAPYQRTACAPTGDEWVKGAFDYLNSKLPDGKRPAVYATVSLVSLEPGTALGKAPDRTNTWYAQGEVVREEFPLSRVFKGKLPMWMNTGTDKAPFNSNNSTLAITIQGNGQGSLHFQIDGRNRMGKGPQSISFNAMPSGSSDNTLMFSTTTEFFGKKFIVLSLVKGEAEAPIIAPKPIGARYKISPSFFVTNSDDGPGDNTLEVQTEIKFYQNGKQVAYLVRGLDMRKGQRVEGTPFEVTVLDADINSHKLRVAGYAYDRDVASKNDEIWRHDMNISIPNTANKTKNKGLITIYPNFIPDDAAGNVDILVQKVADVY